MQRQLQEKERLRKEKEEKKEAERRAKEETEEKKRVEKEAKQKAKELEQQSVYGGENISSSFCFQRIFNYILQTTRRGKAEGRRQA